LAIWTTERDTEIEMTLAGKNVLVFAATGAIAKETAKTLAREGATVYISGRRKDALEALTEEIQAAGGKAVADVVDATDEQAVTDYVARIAQSAGRIDATFNGIGGRPAELGYPMPAASLSLENFWLPIHRIVGSTFLTSRTVGAQMATQEGGGSIITLSATLSRMATPNMANISTVCGAIEALTRALAGDFGGAGVRVNCVRGNAMPETSTIQETMAGQAEIFGITPEAMRRSMAPPPLGRPIRVSETAATAAFLASDAASGISGQIITVCAGAFVG
jgi:3-oxoacyl-[acyl-carrier protein] reductase